MAIGIGGSYLGPLFVHTAMQFDEQCKDRASGRCVWWHVAGLYNNAASKQCWWRPL